MTKQIRKSNTELASPRCYQPTGNDQKLKLYNEVVKCKRPIRQVAAELGIKYSTAKAIIDRMGGKGLQIIDEDLEQLAEENTRLRMRVQELENVIDEMKKSHSQFIKEYQAQTEQKLWEITKSVECQLGKQKFVKAQIDKDLLLHEQGQLVEHEAYHIDVTKDDFQKFIKYAQTGDGIGNIYADPPWEGTGVTNYETMSDAEIKSLNVNDMFRQGYLYLWVTKGKLEIGLEILKKWGYIYADFFIWLKVDENGAPLPAAGRYLSHAVEICLLGRKGLPQEIPRVQVIGNVPDIIIAPREGPQSAKPKIMYPIITTIMQKSRNIELFARENNFYSYFIQIGLGVKNEKGKFRKYIVEDKEDDLGNLLDGTKYLLMEQIRESKRQKKKLARVM